MKLPFTRTEDRVAVAAALAASEAKLSELGRDRMAKLEEPGDQFSAVEAIDKKIEAESRAVSYHRSRLEVIDRQEIKDAQLRVEQERAAFLDELKKKRLPRRLAAAVKLDNAPLKDVPSAHADLIAADDAVYANWPDVMPPASRFGWTRITTIEALSPRRSQKMVAGLVRELASREPYSFATAVAKLNDELMAELEETTVPAAEEFAA
jgi:hypothetical protein